MDLFETIMACDPVPVSRASGFASANEGGKVDTPPVRTPARAHCNLNVLALDLGTHCGWGLAMRDGAVLYGTESFAAKGDHGAKWANYRAWLSKLLRERQVNVLYFEDVKNHAGVLAAHAYGGFLAMAQMVCHQHRVRMEPVGVKTAKKAWTGNGNADKAAMIAEAKRRGFRVANDEDDTADALALLFHAVKKEA
jgi:Holliday junction resolvasome RuvABC endonuclease subunit